MSYLKINIVDEKTHEKVVFDGGVELEPDVLYFCDPEKNTECNKPFCYADSIYHERNSTCFMTTKKECAICKYDVAFGISSFDRTQRYASIFTINKKRPKIHLSKGPKIEKGPDILEGPQNSSEGL